jgi:cytoskeletal protein CcmA (bactofilin family)
VEGHLKGKLAVEGDVTIEPGAVVDGEVKAASVTVAPGAHMRGMVEFG